MCWKCTHPQAIQEVQFVSSSGWIWRNLALLARQWIFRSEWVPSLIKMLPLVKNSHIKIHLQISFQLFPQCLICAYFFPDPDETSYLLEKAILWIEDFS